MRCLWVRETSAEQGETVPVLPDGCTDVMYVDGSLQIAGPDTTVNPALRPAGGRIVGVRFHPGRLGPLVGEDLAELTDRRVALAEVWPGDVQRLAARADEASAGSVPALARLLLDEVTGRIAVAEPPDHLVTQVVKTCLEARGALTMRKLSAELHVSERQLRRRCIRALGYGTKTLDRILRFQRFLQAAPHASIDGLAHAAARAGYADQSHLTRECQRLAGTTPARLLPSRAT